MGEWEWPGAKLTTRGRKLANWEHTRTERDRAWGLKIKWAESVLLKLVGLFFVFVTSCKTKIALL